MSFLKKPTLSYNPLFPHPVHPKVQEFDNIHFIGGRYNSLNLIAKTVIFTILMYLSTCQAICAEQKLTRQNHNWLYEIRAGILAHDVPIWSLSNQEGGLDFNAEFIFGFPNCRLFSGMVCTNLGFSLNSQNDTSEVYSGLFWEYTWDSGLLLNLGLGLAAHDGDLDNSDDKKELGSRILFRIPIEIGLLFTRHQGVLIMFDHVSNAYLADPNEGLDAIGFRYIYRFRWNSIDYHIFNR